MIYYDFKGTILRLYCTWTESSTSQITRKFDVTVKCRKDCLYIIFLMLMSITLFENSFK